MPIEIKVGPPTITISLGRIFMVTTQAGEIRLCCKNYEGNILSMSGALNLS